MIMMRETVTKKKHEQWELLTSQKKNLTFPS